MAVTVASFQAEYPEFVATPEAVVQAKLNAAVRRLDARMLGARYDDAVSLFTAHLLVLSPGGATGRLEKGATSDAWASTTYGAELSTMLSGGFCVGMAPDGTDL